MNTRLLSVGTLAAVLAMATPSFASDEFVKSNSEVFSASTSAQSLGSVEAQKEFKSMLSETTSPAEVAQYDASSENSDKGFYLGGSLGVFFPNFGDGLDNYYNANVDDYTDTGFGGSVFAGYQFNKNWGADVEFTLSGGGLDEEKLSNDLSLASGQNINVEEADYSGWSVMVNPRYTIPFSNNGNESKLSAFISPGIGIAQGDVNGTVNGVKLSDSSETSFAWQIKGGLGYKFNPKLDAFIQVRYFSITELDSNLDNSNLSFFSPEIGIKYKF